MIRSNTHFSGPRLDRGFTLVEILVTLVVLAVGMLGIAGLYVAGLRSGTGSIFRMQAVTMASDIADRIRANRTAHAAYAGAGADNGCVGGVKNCTPAEMAAQDLLVWRAQIAATLPAGAGAIVAVQDDEVFTYQITVSWSEPGQTGASTYQVNFQL